MTTVTNLPDEIFDQTIGVVGRIGSGKSFLARGLVERWLEINRRVCVIDPTDVWWGLRSNAAGDGPGYPIAVFGGAHGDVGISERSGGRIAEMIGTRNLPGNKRRVKAIHARIANTRKDHLHKVSCRLARENALIVVGNVNSSRLAKTRMAKSVLDAGWSSFKTMLSYKASRHSALFMEVDERFTTQVCSCCGVIPSSSPKGMGALGIREWECSDCGAVHDRDVNAARNILKLGRSAAPRGDESQLNTRGCSHAC